MVKVSHFLDIKTESGQVVRMDIPYAKLVVDNINEIKLFINKYDCDIPLNPILEVH